MDELRNYLNLSSSNEAADASDGSGRFDTIHAQQLSVESCKTAIIRKFDEILQDNESMKSKVQQHESKSQRYFDQIVQMKEKIKDHDILMKELNCLKRQVTYSTGQVEQNRLLKDEVRSVQEFIAEKNTWVMQHMSINLTSTKFTWREISGGFHRY